jgi:predicted phosphoribosyltransferase
MLSKDITVPSETSILGTIDQSGGFVYNSMFSTGQIEEYVSEYHNYLETEKMNKTYEINRILGQNGLMDRNTLNNKVIILVSDGVRNGSSFDAALNYLKPVRLKRLVAVTPVASISGVDRMHILADEIHVLNVADNYFDADHYYENNKLPTHKSLMKRLDNLPDSEIVAEKTYRTYT